MQTTTESKKEGAKLRGPEFRRSRRPSLRGLKIWDPDAFAIEAPWSESYGGDPGPPRVTDDEAKVHGAILEMKDRIERYEQPGDSVYYTVGDIARRAKVPEHRVKPILRYWHQTGRIRCTVWWEEELGVETQRELFS